MDRLTQERIAENNARFREANEHIRAAAQAFGITGPVPFICECAQPTCVEIVRLRLDEYASLRANPRTFLNVPGHDRADGSAARVVSEHEGYVVVEKVGHAGDVVDREASA